MSKIDSGEVSRSGSDEVSGNSSATPGGEVGTREVSEAKKNAEITEDEVDADFSSELDDSYSSYMEDGKISDFKREEADKAGESKETAETEENEEPDGSFEQELHRKYLDYFNGEHTLEEHSENSEGTDAVETAKENSEDIESELDKKYTEYIHGGRRDIENAAGRQRELSDTERVQLKEETGWSDEVVDCIDTSEQADIYKNAGLHEENINGRECLVKEIDYDYIDEKTGMTNRELMAKGRSPYDAKTGEKIELHHMGQQYDAPFAELTEKSEHGDGNHSILHPKTEGSWRNNETLEAQYNKEKREYWKTRSEG